MENDRIICPLVDCEISCVECMENTSIKKEFIPEEYKNKENWEEICEKCTYRNF